MTDLAPPTTDAPLSRLSALAARAFADPDEAIAAVLELARDVLGLTTAVVTRSDGDTWYAVHVADAALGLVPGATLPLRDTFCSLVGADEPVVITDALRDPRSSLVAAPARLGIRTFLGVPLVLRDGALYGTLCAFDQRASALGEEAVATLRVLARLVAHELEHARHLAEARDEEEQRFRALVQHASDGITVLGPDGAIRYRSPAVARMLGYEPDEMVEVDPFALIAPEDAVATRRLLTDLAGEPGGSRSADLRVRHRDGSHLVLDTTFTNLLADPRVGGIVVNTRDVTERKAAEAALREAEARFRTLVQNVSDIVSVVAPDGTLRYLSPAVEPVLGYAPADLIGRSAFALLHPDDEAPVRAAFTAYVGEVGCAPRVEARFRHRDGSWRWLEIAGNNEPEDPALGGFILTSREITARKAADAALRASEEHARELAAAAQRQARELALLGEVRTALARELDLTPLIRTVVEATAAAFGGAPVGLFLVEGDELVLQHQKGFFGYDGRFDRIPVSLGVMGRVARAGEPALIEDVGTDPTFLQATGGIVSEICVPLRDEGRVVGVLNLESTDGAGLGEDDLRLMLVIAEHVGVAIGRARLYAEARASVARFRTLVEQLPVVTYLLALDTAPAVPRVLYLSPQAESILGYAPEEWLATPGLWASILHPDDRERVLADALRAEAAGLPIRHEYRLLARDGRIVWVRDESVLVQDGTGGPRHRQGVMLDVTERREAEEALRLRDRAVAAVSDGLVICDARLPDLPMVDVNPAFERMSGYPAAELLGRNCRMLQGSETDPEALAPFRAAITEEREAGTALLNYRKDGTPFWNEVSVAPVRDAAGVTTHFLGVMRDVTERRRAEELRERHACHAALRADVGATLAERGESAEVLRRCTEAIVRHLGAARATIWLLDEAGEALDLAASAGPFSDPRVDGRVPIGRFRVGHVARERVPCVTNDLAADHQEGDKDWASRAGLTSFAGYPLLLEDRLVGVVALFAPEPLADDTLAALGAVADVLAQGIERRRAEAALRSAEARFRALVENSADIVTLVDADGIVLFQSPAVTTSLGYRPEERIGRDAFALMHPDDGPPVRAWFAELATAPERGSRVEFRARHRDGTWRWFEAVGASLVDDPGARGFLVQSRDVTERKRAEDALRRSEASLAEAQRLAHLGSWELDLATGEGRWSDESYRIFGLPPDEAPLTQRRYLEIVHPDDRRRLAAEIEERTARGDEIETEYRIVRPDGSVRFLHLQGEVVRDGAGRPVRLLGTNQDVTERREAEERLREAEAKYRSLVERLPAVVYSERLLDGNSAAFPRYIAPQVADLIGYTQEEWLADPALWGKRLHPDDRPAVFAAYERAERGGVPYHGEYRLLARDGRAVWVRDDAVLLRDAAGRARGWQGVMLDVTDRREAEARLRESEVRYRALVESLPAIVSTQAVEGKSLVTTYVSPQVSTILGYPADEVFSDDFNWLDLVHPDDRERVRAENQRTNATGERFRTEYRQRARDGRWVWLRDEAVLVPGTNGRPGYWLSVQFDVTEGKAAEEALHRSEARFRALIQNGSDVVSVLAADGTIGYQSPALGRVLGYAAEELEGRNVFEHVHPEDVPAVADAFAALAADPGGRAVVELRFRHKDGSWRALDALGVNLLDDPAVGGVVVNSRDVTERRRAEAEIAQALATQQAANAELERLSRVKSDFVSVVSHEFRTPLTSIQGFSELIRDEALPSEEIKEFADDINRNARRLARLTGEMLDLDRLRSGRIPLRRKPVDLNAAVAEVVATLRPAAPRHAFALDLDPSLPPLIGDRDRLGQVVTNLLDNAVKYAPGGGEIAVASRRDGDVVHLEVRDRGVGIPPQALETVFEWYTRVESGAAAPGTGLGLPITREIVELHGGGIWAESEPGHGTSFHVVLPLAGAPESPGSGNGLGQRWRAWFSARTAGAR